MVKDGTSFDVLADRYGVGFAQQILDQLQDVEHKPIDVFDIMGVNEAVAGLRKEIKGCLSSYRFERNQNDVARNFYVYHELAAKRRHIGYLWRVYRMAKADSRKLTDEYLHRLKHPQFALMDFASSYKNTA